MEVKQLKQFRLYTVRLNLGNLVHDTLWVNYTVLARGKRQAEKIAEEQGIREYKHRNFLVLDSRVRRRPGCILVDKGSLVSLL